jgi:threonine/homoserine/homoserine lactone efflux protein
MNPMLFGLSTGLASGISPGPLFALIVSTAIERGMAAGIRVAMAPFLVDVPLVAICLLVVRQVPPALLPLLSIAGGLVLGYFAWDTWRASAQVGTPAAAPPASGDIWRGAAAGFLSPHPWLFWITVGGPTLIATWRASPAEAIGFLAMFYLGLVGSKVLIAVLVARGARHLDPTWHRRALVGCALLLAAFALMLLWQGTGVARLAGGAA